MPTCRDNWRAKKRRRDANRVGTGKAAINFALRDFTEDEQAHIRGEIASLPLVSRRLVEEFWREMNAVSKRGRKP